MPGTRGEGAGAHVPLGPFPNLSSTSSRPSLIGNLPVLKRGQIEHRGRITFQHLWLSRAVCCSHSAGSERHLKFKLYLENKFNFVEVLPSRQLPCSM